MIRWGPHEEAWAMLSDDEYTDEELDGLNTWFQLEHEKLPSSPFTFFFAKFKSGTDELTELMLDPLATLQGRGPAGDMLGLSAVNGETRINTTIFGHERTLKARMMYAMATVDSQDNSVSLTTHKAKPNSG
jgi:hypothetical protein